MEKKSSVKKEILKIIGKNSWSYDEKEFDSIKIGKYTRSIYLHLETEDNKKAFFKMPLEKRAKENLKREIVYLEFANKKAPGISPEIIDYHLGRRKWSLVEDLHISDGFIAKEEETESIKKEWLNWVIDSLSSLENLNRLPKNLYDLSFRRQRNSQAKFYEARIKFHTSKLRKNASRFPEITEVVDRISSFIQENKHKIKKAENKGERLIHGDLAPNNIFFDKTRKKAVFLDWEWASVSTNSLIAPGFDFSNMYLRSWRNKKFQKSFLKKYILRKLASPLQLKIATALSTVSQLRITDKKHKKESEAYRREHTRRLIESANEVLDL